MTRGQDSLVIDMHDSTAGAGGAVASADLSRLALPVLRATDEEQQAHLALLKGLDKASGGKTVWQEAPAAESGSLAA